MAIAYRTNDFETLDKPAKSMDLTRTVDHQQHEYNTSRGDGVIVLFKVGYYERPSAEHQQAQQRVMDALGRLHKELAMMRAWDGAVSVHSMTERLVNPEITPAMIESFVAAAVQAYPEMKLGDQWQNSSHGVRGYSVFMQPKD